MKTRKLAYSEKMSTLTTGGTQKARARAAATRHIEELGQNDRMLFLLQQQTQLLAEQNQLLRYMADTMYRLVSTQPSAQSADWAPPAPPE